MRALELYRSALRALAAQASGDDPRSPKVVLGQRRAQAAESDLLSLPADLTRFAPLMDYVSGEWYAIPDVIPADGGPAL